EEATARLYGPVVKISEPIPVYIGTSCRKGKGAFALWRGTDSKWNKTFTLESGTEARAAILAVLCAARDYLPERSLVVYMGSEYVIRSFCYWAGDNETRGWSCANGDELRDAVAWIARRSAPMEFRFVSSKTANTSLRAAKEAAK
ncbi:hypothetical protein C8R47DRAFT_920404, partial [Mycena vitilis]